MNAQKIFKAIALLLSPLLIILIGAFVYFAFKPVHPTPHPYVELQKRRSFSHSFRFETEAAVGNYRLAILLADTTSNPPKPETLPPEFPQYHPVDALVVIGSAANDRGAIFINEAHHVPQHRAFTLSLLPLLYEKGFRYFAVEALGDDDPELSERKYPLGNFKTGTYVEEPVYGDLIRTALRLGYTLVPYEARNSTGIQDREMQQATNLVNRVFKRDPSAKLLVHAGYAHITEDPKNPWMAQHFKSLTGIDPLTIDQTEEMEHSSPVYEAPEYRFATEKNLVSRPVFFLNERGSYWRGHRIVDMALFHPLVTYEYSRPTWLKMNGARKPFAIRADSVNITPPYLAQAFIKSERPQRKAFFVEYLTIPLDQVEITERTQSTALYLYAGEYNLTFVNQGGSEIKSIPIRVY